jgi:predicted small lipoprotein YifL
MTKRAPVLLVAVVALAGCGLRDPYAQQPPTLTATVRGQATQAPLPQATLEGANGASNVLVRFASTWVNWSPATLASERGALLALATGQLAGELRRGAAQAVRTQLQEVSQAYSRGRYVGVIRDERGRAIVVTYEEVALLGGQAQGAYHLYLARTERTTLGWRVTEWQPATDS